MVDLSVPGAFALNLDCPCCYRPGVPLPTPSVSTSSTIGAATAGTATATATSAKHTAARHKLAALRGLLREHDLDAYLIFSEDAHNSEYVSRCDERRSYLTGFTGSAGVALVTRARCGGGGTADGTDVGTADGTDVGTANGTDAGTEGEALLWTDSRYFIQAEEQLGLPSSDAAQVAAGSAGPPWTLMKMYEPGVPQVEEYLYTHLRGKKIGLDPSTFANSRASLWNGAWSRKAAAAERATADPAAAEVPVLVPVVPNLVDEMWPPALRPSVPQNPIVVQPLNLAGESVASKLRRLRSAVDAEYGRAGGATAGNDSDSPPVVSGCVVSALDQIAWLFNLRGSDIDCNPVFFSYAVLNFVPADRHDRGAPTTPAPGPGPGKTRGAGVEAHLFLGRRTGLDGNWITEDVLRQLRGDSDDDENGVILHSYRDFGHAALDAIFPDGGTILVEKSSCSMAVAEAIVDHSSSRPSSPFDVASSDGTTITTTARPRRRALLETSDSASPIERFKSVKNASESDGLRACCLRDSLAICRFAAWLAERVARGKTSNDDNDDLKEAALAARLLEYRQRQSPALFTQNSFPTISSVGPNSAIVHYCPTPGSDSERTLTANDVYLLDSGGQYVDGTTDVTRTYHFGDGHASTYAPSAATRRRYTRVLQGHISLAQTIFPTGTSGIVLDALARSPLWKHGMTYGHGTGHGIGSRLNVHEGPAGIGGANQPGNVVRSNPWMQAYYLEPILEGMFLSNEPGYYLEGKYGFRIESDMLVVPAEAFCDDDDDDDDNDKKEKAEKTERQQNRTKFLRFDTLTKVPMCRSLVDASLLTSDEREWLNSYHADCRESLLPLLALSSSSDREGGNGGDDEHYLFDEEDDERTRLWLIRETEEL